MNKIKEIRDLSQEAQFLREKKLDHNLIKIFSQDWEGTRKERERLNDLQRQLRDELYIEVIYVLTHKIISDVQKAKEMYKNIVDHKATLAKKLKRNVGIEVAALDYMKNIRSELDKPEIIESDKLVGLATKAILDEGTSIYGRTAFFANLKADIDRAKRYGRPVSLLFCDIDDFKKVNDAVGHEMGNSILKIVSQNIRDALRETDMAFRYGGEEFVCILPETDIKSARIAASRVRQKIEKMKTPNELKKNKLKVTVSVGLAQYGLNNIYDVHSLVNAADRAMYQAKKNGKNLVCVYGIDFKENKIYKEKKRKIEGSQVISGKVLSPGIAMGQAFIYQDILTSDILSYVIKEENVEEELRRIQEALDQVHRELDQTKEVVKKTVNKQNADIFEAHKMILKDEKLLMDLEKELNRELINAEQAVRNVFRRWSNRLRSSQNEFIRDKADDMDDLSRRIIRELLGYKRNILERLPPNSIIVAKRLLPSDTVHLNRKNAEGILLKEGGYNSHSAILARSLGIPAIYCRNESIVDIKRETILLIDGENMKVTVNPGKKEIENFEKRINKFRKHKDLTVKRSKQKALTKEGKRIMVLANASGEEDFKEAARNGCDGIGLLRIENLYLEHKTAPSPEYLTKHLKQMLKCAGKKKVVLRLLDIGGDKQLPYLNAEEGRNPFLGLRGIRLLLEHENILKAQLEVALNLHKEFDVKILVPMVTLSKEIKKVREIIAGVKTKLKIEAECKLGAMIETPASVVNIERIAQVSDFLSIGTNDLIQYTMAAGRENMSMAKYYHEGAETIMKVIKNVVTTANKYSIPCSICGEIAGDQEYIEPLLMAGVRELSVSPSRIPFVKKAIRNIKLEH
jgi:phosphoenolpyruvate-protein phosphotransferase